MKRLYNLMLVCMLMVTLSACGKQAGKESIVDAAAGQDGET